MSTPFARYCIPLDDDRPFLTAEKTFFSEGGTGNGMQVSCASFPSDSVTVPVIVIFTKFDAMDDKAFSELTRSGMSIDDAKVQAPGHAVMMFDRDLRDVLYGMKYPPKNHVLLRGKVLYIDRDISSFRSRHEPSTCNMRRTC